MRLFDQNVLQAKTKVGVFIDTVQCELSGFGTLRLSKPKQGLHLHIWQRPHLLSSSAKSRIHQVSGSSQQEKYSDFPLL